MKGPPITLTTDFGDAGPYVAAMKGVILTIDPDAVIVDVSHRVPPQDIRTGGFILSQAAPWFPPGTIHVAVVDPGVGTDREILYARIADQQFIAPDNGLLSLLAAQRPPEPLIWVREPRFWRQPVSATFHGRDIMAPVAARLSCGLDPAELGPPAPRMVELARSEPCAAARSVSGEVLAVDDFGNLITNIPAGLLPPAATVIRLSLAGRPSGITRIDQTYGQQPPGTLMALVGSGGLLEVSVNGGSAARRLGAAAGSDVRLEW